MYRRMVRLYAALNRRRVVVLVVWGLVFLSAVPFALRQSENLTGGGFIAEDSQSTAVNNTIAEDFPLIPPATLAVALVPQGASSSDMTAARDTVLDEIRAVPALSPIQPAADAPGPAADRPYLVTMSVPDGESVAIDAAEELRDRLDISADTPAELADGRVQAHVLGQGALFNALQEDSQTGATNAEIRGFPVITIVLLAVFGSLLASAVPLSVGVAAVVITAGMIYLLSLATEMSIYVTNMTSMLGIAVAVDYSLFVLMRYREERAAGRTHDEAGARALATSGAAALFSGLTVIASLLGLFLIGSTAISSMAIGGIVVVSMAMLTTATLLPVLLGLFGHRLEHRARWLTWRRDRGPRESFWARWARTVMRRPVAALTLATIALLLLAAPALQLQIGNSALRQLSPDHEIRAGVDAVSAADGPGALGPAPVLISFYGVGVPGDPAAVRTYLDVRAAIERDPAVRSVSGPVPGADGGDQVVLAATFDVDPESVEARQAVERLRADLPPVAGDVATVEVGGTTATVLDFDEMVGGSLPWIAAFVLMLSFVVLLVSLRSVALAIKAVLMTTLTLLVAYGAVVIVFQWGWLEFLGLQPADYIDTLTPPLVLVVAFGLSMDYEIFLLSRIRERYEAGASTREAVADGLSSSARTITSAALIMVVVFLAFVSAGLPSVQRLGLACAVAIAADATVVRLVLVPATMVLLDRWNWWLPGWLDRILPRIHPEGPAGSAVPASVTGTEPVGVGGRPRDDRDG